MIDETTHDTSVSKKVDGRGSYTKLGQNPKNSFSRIKTQTFTILKSAFCVKIAFLRISKRLSRAVNTWLRSVVCSFLSKISAAFSSRNLGLSLKKQISGYVLILMTALIPVLLLGTKYILDLRTLHKVQIENGDDENI